MKVFLGAGRDFVKRDLGFGRKKHELLLTGVYLGVFGPHVGIQVLHLLGQVAAAAALVSINKYFQPYSSVLAWDPQNILMRSGSISAREKQFSHEKDFQIIFHTCSVVDTDPYSEAL